MNPHNETFQLACKNGTTEVVKFLLQNNNVDPCLNDSAALVSACESGNTEEVKILLADDRIDVTDKSMLIALTNQKLDVLKILLDEKLSDESSRELETREDIESLLKSYLIYPKADKVRYLKFNKNSINFKPNNLPKEALIMGLNYIGHKRGQLKGCINDANNMKQYLVDKCNLDSYMLMTDRTYIRPTKAYMIYAIKYMVSRIKKRGGTLFIHYSGHGGQVRNYGGDVESDGKDETMIPLDYMQNGQIIDDDIYKMLVEELEGCENEVRCIIIMDMCHSGTAMDLAHSYDINENGNVTHKESEKEGKNVNIFMISGCRDNQTSSDVREDNDAYGALTKSVLNTLDLYEGNLTWKELMTKVNIKLHNYTQIAQLSSEKPLNLDSKINW